TAVRRGLCTTSDTTARRAFPLTVEPSVLPQVTRPGGAESRVAWMALTRARADSAVSSTATRAAGPAPGSRKSMLRVCSAWACTGWSKYTLASVSRNHPDGPLPLPLIETFSVRYVHMPGSSQPRGGLQVAAVEVPDALPGLHGRFGPV